MQKKNQQNSTSIHVKNSQASADSELFNKFDDEKLTNKNSLLVV